MSSTLPAHPLHTHKLSNSINNNKNSSGHRSYFSSSYTKKFRQIFNQYLSKNQKPSQPNINDLLNQFQSTKIKDMTEKELLKEEIGQEIKKFSDISNLMKKTRKTFDDTEKSLSLGRVAKTKEDRMNFLQAMSKMHYNTENLQEIQKQKEKEKKREIFQRTAYKYCSFDNNNNNLSKSGYSSKNITSKKFISRGGQNLALILRPLNTETMFNKTKRGLKKNFNFSNTISNNKRNTFKILPTKTISSNNNLYTIDNDNDYFLNEKDDKKKIDFLETKENEIRKKKKGKIYMSNKVLDVWRIGREKIDIYCDGLNEKAINTINKKRYDIQKFNNDWNNYKKIQEYFNPEVKESLFKQ